MDVKTVSGTPYRVRKAKLSEDAPAILQLWADGLDGLAGEAGAKKLEWLYRENPDGAGEVFVLVTQEDDLVGSKGFGRRAFGVGEGVATGAIMADFVVKPGHRSLGPALSLLKESISSAKASVAFLYGFPNKTALGVFKRAGVEPTLEIRRFAKVLRSKHLLRERLPKGLAAALSLVTDPLISLMGIRGSARALRNLRWAEVADFDERFDELWASSEGGRSLIAVRSGETLRWRFLRGPRRVPVKVLVAESPKTGKVAGYAVWGLDEGKALILDIFAGPRPDIFEALLRGCSRKAKQAGCDSISVEISCPRSFEKPLRRAGFIQRGSSPVMVIKGKGPGFESGLPWYLTNFDRD